MKLTDTTLGDVALNIQTGPFGSQLHSSDYSDEGTPVIMPQDIVDWKISECKIARVGTSHVNRLKRYICKTDDIIYPRRGDLAKCAFITLKENGWLCGTGCLRVTIDNSLANPQYVYFHLQQPYSISCIELATVGSTMPNLNTTILSKVKLRLPSLTTQNKIVDFLSKFDELIEVNNRRISILEEMAMRTYQEWFVHFRFPGHETTEFINGLPAKWEEKMLGDVIEFDRGCSYTSEEIDVTEGVNLINLKNIQAYGGYNYDGLKLFGGTYKSRHIVKQGDLVMGVTDMTQDRRTVGAVALIPKYNETSIISTDLVKMRSKIPNIFLYCMFRFGGISKFVSEFANGSNVLHLKPTSIRKQWLCIPKDEIIIAFDNFITPIVQEMESLTFQNFQLQQMRDRLLPQLMSGQLEVTTNEEAL